MSDKQKAENNTKETKPRVVVSAFIFDDKNKLFLVRGHKHNLKYTPPGGGVEAGEKLEEALKGEVVEKTGIKIKDMEMLGVIDGYRAGKFYNGNYKHLIFIDFKAHLKGRAKPKLNKEFSEYKWQTLDEWLSGGELDPYTEESIKRHLMGAGGVYADKYHRALADYQNLLKQTASEKAALIKYANEELLKDLIPVFDNLKMAISHGANEKSNSWLEGTRYVVKQFREVLKQNGVEEIVTKGKKFDHNLMEAVSGSGEKVARELKSGYTLNGKVIIPAKVELY